MSKFSYTATSETGSSITGTLDADSVDMAANALIGRGLIPLKVAPERGSASGSSMYDFKERLTRVKIPELILFTKQFRTLLKAGVPMLKLLEVLENQTENIKLKKIAAIMRQDIKQGATLYDSFRKHPGTFSPLYCSMLLAGETSGAVPEVLERLTRIIQHEHKVKSDIMSALQYPIMVCISLSVAFFVLLTFVIPKFASVFNAAGLQLPLPTVICMNLYAFVHNYWYLGLMGIAALGFGLSYYLKTESGKYYKDALVLRLPIFGPLFVKAAMSRFASIFAILQASGVPVLDALKVLAGALGNRAIGREFEKIRTRVEEGRGITGPLSSARYFTPMVINMVAVGEESGNLDEMLREVSVHYDDEVAHALSKLSEALGPILIVGLAAVVGFFALAIFLPMWDLTKMVH
ncbi:MAG: type II secretion system F family protein [Syntrophobacteraceae bacterium]